MSFCSTLFESPHWYTVKLDIRSCLSLCSQIAIRVRDGKKLTHDGIKVEFVGSIGMLPTLLSSQTLDLHVRTFL